MERVQSLATNASSNEFRTQLRRIHKDWAPVDGLAAGSEAEAKIFDKWNPPELNLVGTNGVTLATISGFVVTYVRAPLTTGGYTCYMTLRVLGTSRGWTTDSVQPLIVNSRKGNGVLNVWECRAIDIECADNGKQFFLRKDFNPDWFPLVDTVEIIPVGGAKYWKCRS